MSLLCAILGNMYTVSPICDVMDFDVILSFLRWPITATTITRRSTVNKENLTNQKVLHTYKKGLPPYKQDLLTYTKKDLLIYTKNPRQIPTANSCGNQPWQIPAANSHGEFLRQIATTNSQICNTEDGVEQSSMWESFKREVKKKTSTKTKDIRINLIN